MRFLLLVTLCVLSCSSAPIDKVKSRKGKQLDFPIVSSGYSTVSRGAPNIKLQDEQSKQESPSSYPADAQARSSVVLQDEENSKELTPATNGKSMLETAEIKISDLPDVKESLPTAEAGANDGLTVLSMLDSVPVPKKTSLAILEDGTEILNSPDQQISNDSPIILSPIVPQEASVAILPDGIEVENTPDLPKSDDSASILGTSSVISADQEVISDAALTDLKTDDSAQPDPAGKPEALESDSSKSEPESEKVTELPVAAENADEETVTSILADVPESAKAQNVADLPEPNKAQELPESVNVQDLPEPAQAQDFADLAESPKAEDAQPKTIAETKTLSIELNTELQTNEEAERSLLDTERQEQVLEITEIAEPVTSVELLSDEVIQNFPSVEESKLDDFSSSVILDSQPLPKEDDSGSIIELVPSNAGSLFDLEMGEAKNVNDLVKRSSDSGSVASDDGDKKAIVNPLTKPIFENLPGLGRAEELEAEDKDFVTIIEDADEPEDPAGSARQDPLPAEELIIAEEAKPECDDDAPTKESFVVEEVHESTPRTIEEIESEVIRDAKKLDS